MNMMDKEKVELDTLGASLFASEFTANPQEDIKFLLKASGLSYSQLGDRLSVSKHEIYKWRHGKRRPIHDNEIMIHWMVEKVRQTKGEIK